MLGGITVLTGLNPYVVGAHFAVSIVLVAVTTTLLWRGISRTTRAARACPAGIRDLVHGTSLLVAVTVVIGILTTGSGPHAGDNSDPLEPAPRNGLDPELLQHVHSWPAYVTVAPDSR